MFEKIYNRILLYDKMAISSVFKINLNNLSFRRLIKELLFIPKNLIPEKSAINDKNKIIFVLIFNSHLNHALPILRKLKDNNIGFSIITIRDKFENQLYEFKNDVFSINKFYNFFDYYFGCIYQIYKYSLSIIRLDKVKAYYILKLFKISYLIEKAFINLIQNNNVKKIILFKGDGVEALTITSLVKDKYDNIKLISIQHGVIGVSEIHKDLFLDEFWVWSDFFKSRLLESKVGCNIRIVGDPTKDKLFKSKSLRKIKKNKKANKILFLPNSGNSFTSESQVIHSCKIISDFSKENKNYNILVKAHPGDDNNLVESFLAKNSSLITIIDKNEDIIENNFFDADIIVINNSGIGNASAIFGIPIIIIAERLDQLWVNQYLENNIAEISLTYNEFVRNLQKILSDYSIYSQNCKLFTDITYDFRGKSLNKILSLIKENKNEKKYI